MLHEVLAVLIGHLTDSCRQTESVFCSSVQTWSRRLRESIALISITTLPRSKGEESCPN